MSSGPESLGDLVAVEEIVRAAGNYVEPSDDLRPRVIESVRRRRSADRTRARLSAAGGGLLLFVLLVGGRLASLDGLLPATTPDQRVARLVANNEMVIHRSSIEGFSWRLVEALLSVREQQVEAFARAKNTPNPVAFAAQTRGDTASK